ncbi:MAG: hypothetical protein KJO55_00970, partial [Gammaproteobacteria bacterium]|nr:hypothetical protein [Gammaproteobacteria bacterium]
AVVSAIAAMAMPTFSDVHVRRLESASSELIAALQFARQESIRTGIPHGVRRITGQNQVAVFHLDMTSNPPVEVYDLSHPVDRTPKYQIAFDNHPHARGTKVLAHFRIYTGGSDEAISFNARGEPIQGTTGLPLRRAYGGFLLNNGDYGLVVSVSRLTGRIFAGEIGGTESDPLVVF